MRVEPHARDSAEDAIDRQSDQRVRWFAAAAGVWLLATPAIVSGDDGADGADGRVAVSHSFDRPETVRTGTPLTVSMTVDHPPDADVRFRSRVRDSNWELLGTERRGDAGRTVFEIRYAVYRPGTATLPAQTVDVDLPDGQSRRLETSPIEVEVVSSLDGTSERSLAEARPPRAPPKSGATWLLYLAAPLTLGLAGAGLYWYRRRAEAEREATPGPSPRTEVDRALARLRRSDYLDRGEVVRFYAHLSSAVRRYLGRTFGYPGVELTSGENLRRLGRRGALSEQTLASLADWFRHVDRAKFSGARPESGRAGRALDRAGELVESIDKHALEQTPPDDRPDESIEEDSERSADRDGPDAAQRSSDSEAGRARWKPETGGEATA